MRPNIATNISEYPGTLIVLEGVDASGKTTQAVRISNELRKKGKKVSLSGWNQTPYFSNYFKNQVTAESKKVITPEAHIFLQIAEFLYRLERKILPALKRGEVVILDRGIESIQIRARMLGFSDKQIYDSMCWFNKDIYKELSKRTHTIYLSIGSHEGIERITKRQELFFQSHHSRGSVLSLDRFEMMEFSPDGYKLTDEHKRMLTKDAYKIMIQTYENTLGEREDVYRIDGQSTKNSIEKEILGIIYNVLEDNKK